MQVVLDDDKNARTHRSLFPEIDGRDGGITDSKLETAGGLSAFE